MLSVRGAGVNRRNASRHAVQAPVIFSWIEKGQQKTSDGWTRDINVAGAYILTSHCPPEGSRTSLEIVLPPLGKEGQILKIHMDAHVLRVETAEAGRGSGGF